jgi:SPRY domain-containing SOCS box protein 1/4
MTGHHFRCGIDWNKQKEVTKYIFVSAETAVHSVGYQCLVGSNEHSWGWDIGRFKAIHNSKICPGLNIMILFFLRQGHIS